MKVKDLIKELSIFDPETPISHGVFWVEEMPAYYDGSCYYINEQDQAVYTREGKKVVFRTYDDVDIIWRAIERNPKISLEEVEKLFLHDKEPHSNWKKYIKESYEDTLKYFTNSINEWSDIIKNNMKDGWKYLIDRQPGIYSYGEIFRLKDKVNKNCCGGEIRALLDGDQFEKKDFNIDLMEFVIKE